MGTFGVDTDTRSIPHPLLPLSLSLALACILIKHVQVIHARWALLGALGILTPELLAKYANFQVGSLGPVWFKDQAQILTPEGFNYLGTHNSLPAVTERVQRALLGQAEAFRVAGEAPGVEGLDPLYPGGPFDPLGLGNDPDTLAELKVKELKNGRLAMVATAGFFVQAILTKESPLDNLFGARTGGRPAQGELSNSSCLWFLLLRDRGFSQ